MNLLIYSTITQPTVYNSVEVLFTFKILLYFLLDSYTPLPMLRNMAHLATWQQETGIAFFFNLQLMRVSLPVSLSTADSDSVHSTSQDQFLLLISLLSHIRALPFRMRIVTTRKNKKDEEIFLCPSSTVILIAPPNPPPHGYFLTPHCPPTSTSLTQTISLLMHSNTYPVPWVTYLNWLKWVYISSRNWRELPGLVTLKFLLLLPSLVFPSGSICLYVLALRVGSR